jgi:hypothetical protein
MKSYFYLSLFFCIAKLCTGKSTRNDEKSKTPFQVNFSNSKGKGVITYMQKANI